MKVEATQDGFQPRQSLARAVVRRCDLAQRLLQVKWRAR
jgi:hypothetical protein